LSSASGEAIPEMWEVQRMRRRRRRPARRKPSQHEIIRDLMLSAAECRTWLTLRELAAITGYEETSISAQLRHLRKPRFGAFLLEKRVRAGAETSSQRAKHRRLWEYQLGAPEPSHMDAEELLLESERVAETL